MVDANTSPKQYAILLNSAVGYKESSWYKEPSWYKDVKDRVLGKQLIEKHIIGGTLLEALSEKEILVLAPRFNPVLNYKTISSVYIYCKPKQVKKLSYEEMKYLQAVKNCNDRLEALPKLDWIGCLTDGTDVFLNIPTVFGHPIKGTIRYVGNLPGPDHCGTYFGLELLVSTYTYIIIMSNCNNKAVELPVVIIYDLIFY